jgi:hypothetical protein
VAAGFTDYGTTRDCPKSQAERLMIQQRGPEGKGCLESEFFCPLLSTKNRIKIKRTKMFELPRHLFPAGTGFAE